MVIVAETATLSELVKNIGIFFLLPPFNCLFYVKLSFKGPQLFFQFAPFALKQSNNLTLAIYNQNCALAAPSGLQHLNIMGECKQRRRRQQQDPQKKQQVQISKTATLCMHHPCHVMSHLSSLHYYRFVLLQSYSCRVLLTA